MAKRWHIGFTEPLNENNRRGFVRFFGVDADGAVFHELYDDAGESMLGVIEFADGSVVVQADLPDRDRPDFKPWTEWSPFVW